MPRTHCRRQQGRLPSTSRRGCQAPMIERCARTGCVREPYRQPNHAEDAVRLGQARAPGFRHSYTSATEATLPRGTPVAKPRSSVPCVAAGSV